MGKVLDIYMKPLEEEFPVSKPISHPNIRGSSYYEGESSC